MELQGYISSFRKEKIYISISFRIDFRGSGESEGKWEDTTCSGQASDGLAAIEFLHTNEWISKQLSSNITLLGLSNGGLIASIIASKDKRIMNVILWNPVTNPAETFSGVF